MENSDAIIKLITSLSSSIDEISSELESSDEIISKSLNEILNEISASSNDANPLEKAKVYNLYAYVISSLYFIYLKSSGLKKIDDHPLKQELDRVKSYIKRTTNIENGVAEEQERTKVDTEAMKRMIQRQLGGSGEPAVSKVHFQGKLTKFDEEDKNDKKQQIKPSNSGKLPAVSKDDMKNIRKENIKDNSSKQQKSKRNNVKGKSKGISKR